MLPLKHGLFRLLDVWESGQEVVCWLVKELDRVNAYQFFGTVNGSSRRRLVQCLDHDVSVLSTDLSYYFASDATLIVDHCQARLESVIVH